MELTALAICEDWKPYDPEWVEFCEEVRRQAMLLLEQEDPLCAQYAQDLLNADAVDRVRWVSGSPPVPQRVCYMECLGEDCNLYCYDAAAHNMPRDRVPWLVEHEGCHFTDPECSDRRIRNSDGSYSPAIGSGAYEANRCIGEELEPWY